MKTILLLLLLLVFDGGKAWGQPFTVTTDTDNSGSIEESEKHYYFIQGAQVPTFYCLPASNGTNVSTTNVPSENMLWYFLDAGSDNNIQYYYIVHKSGKYLYKKDDNNGGIQLTTTSPSTDNYKFRIEAIDSYYFIRVKGSNNYVNKKSGNVSLDPLKNSTASDNNSQWKFIAKDDLSWEFPFTFSTNETKAYYKINHKLDASFYISLNGTSVCTSDATDDDNMVWYFEQVPTEKGSNNYITYCYIVNAVTGKYMHFDGTVQDNSQDNACSVQTKTNENETKCQFIVVRAAKTGGKDNKEVIECYAIIPRFLQEKIWKNHCIGKKDNTVGTGVYTATDRNNNTAHWLFVPTDYVPVEAPTITNNFDGTISLSTTTPGATIYYTTNGDTPDNTSTEYSSAFSLGDATVIKAIAYVGSDYSDVTTYDVPQHGAPTISFNSATQQVTINGLTGATIYYTTDGSTPTISNYTGTGTTTVIINGISSATTVKAIATHAGYLTSTVTELAITQVATPTITINADNSVTISCATIGATIYYKTGGADPTIANATQGASIASILPSQGPIKAFAIKDNYLHSNIATESSIPAKTITVNSSNGTLTSEDPIVYDGNAHQPAFTIKDGETTISSDEYTSAYSDNTNAGTATITITDKASGDYNVSGSFTFTITPKTLTITAEAKSKTYGEADPTLTFTSEGLIGTDAITGALAREVGENAGTYAITQNTLTAGNNYSISYTGADLTINKKGLTVTANNHSITYGDAPAGNGVEYSGFVNSETASVLGGTLDYDYSYAQYGDVGNTYTITPKGLTSGNYDISYNNGTLTVNPKEIGIEWTNTEFTYNGSEQAPTATATGLVNNDEVNVTVTGGETNAGDYTATASAITGPKASNYQLPEANTQSFTISPKSIGDGNKPADGITINLLVEENVVTLNSVKDGETTLVVNQDYTYVVENDGADKVVVVTGIGNYKDSAKGIYANPVFIDPDGESSGKAAAVYTASQDLACPNSIKPYIVRKVNPSIGTLTITQLDYIPEGVPVLLLSDAETSGFVASPKDEATPEITAGTKNSNQLKVSQGGETVAAAQIYMFYQGEFVLTKAGTLGEGKYFLYNPNFTATSTPAAQSRSVLQFVIDEDVTEVDDIRSKMADVGGDWYTLDGQRLNGQPTKSGIYIRKGQKMYIKRK